MNNYLQSIDKREEWKNFYKYSNPKHPEDEVKNVLIDRIDVICPGFEYLVDFDWEVERGYSNKGKGDLIFGSDCGVYLIVETKSLHPGSGRTAQVSRHNSRHKVKEQANRYREIAIRRFGINAKVIGATFTNEDYQIHFLDDYDEQIAKHNPETQFLFLWTVWFHY
ncbi:6156_t:CDS:2 [Acaulospora morrowiae]|uniref:6156_t:CDS:1 n=1 Tax=Acaulospora morrowiae TaxID=94023 RepID=A0A9N8ZRU3_9GLOM|nr:6156_t:CDS:2 [Acaulospora morrowiae]